MRKSQKKVNILKTIKMRTVYAVGFEKLRTRPINGVKYALFCVSANTGVHHSLVFLLVSLAEADDLFDAHVGAQLLTAHRHLDEVVHEVLRQVVHVRRPGGAEHHRLLLTLEKTGEI